MLLVQVTDYRPRRWTMFRRRGFTFSLPETWAEVKHPRRWVARILQQGLPARDAFLRTVVPFRYRIGMSGEDWAALRLKTEWMEPRSDCKTLPLPSYTHKGVAYFAPLTEGANMTCGEFAVADTLYPKAAQGDVQSAQILAAIVYREANPNPRAAAKRGDLRTPFHHQTEAEVRVKRQGKIPIEVQACAMLYFSGLKEFVATTYGSYLFEEPDTDDDGNPIPVVAIGPDFGWWGILQGVAESGTFGTLEQVYQAGLHEVCIYLVRKKVEHDHMLEQVQRSSNSTNTRSNFDDDV